MPSYTTPLLRIDPKSFPIAENFSYFMMKALASRGKNEGPSTAPASTRVRAADSIFNHAAKPIAFENFPRTVSDIRDIVPAPTLVGV
jgi:hypothetical protein